METRIRKELEMEILGEVKDVKILKQGRGGINGLIIEFETEANITKDSVVQLEYNGDLKPFNVMEIEIKGKNLIGRAKECGYIRLEHENGLDLRNLLGINIELVSDQERLKQIDQESRWC